MAIICKEFYIGKYIYLTTQLEELPEAVFNRMGKYRCIALYTPNPETGKKKRSRITKKNPEYSKYKAIAIRRLHLKKLLKITIANWEKDYRGDLEDIASHYKIIPNTDCVFNSEFYSRLKNNSNTYENNHKVMHEGIVMRSQFEAETATVLDELGIDYKYEVELRFQSGGRFYPDFGLDFSEYNRCGFLEALGGLDNFQYVSNNAKKFDAYFNAGLYPNRDIAFIAGDKNYRPDHETMKRIIGVMADALARQYVVRKD